MLYVCIVPPWGHYDEPTHFEYAWLIANRLSLPRAGEYDQDMRREVASSMLEHRFFRDADIRLDLIAQDEPTWLGFSELGHPPLYYLMVALPMRVMRYNDWTVQLYLGRLVSLLLYLCSIWLGYRLVGELVAPSHPLRWAVPAMMALLPAYTDLMTSVNSDVGAVVIFSLFLWGAVRTVLYDVSIVRLGWILAAAALCVWTKNTASIAVALLPVVLIMALLRQPWRWWLGLILLAAIPVIGFALFSWGDAASWYRATTQTSSTSQKAIAAPIGERAIAVEIAPDEPTRQVVQFLPDENAHALQGMTVTLGAWVWATQPADILSPIIYDGQQYSARSLQVGVEPAFHTITTTISPDADRLQVILAPSPGSAQGSGVVVYYDGVVLVEGTPQGQPSMDDSHGLAGTWDGQPFANVVRNSSAEITGPRVRPWVDRPLQKYTRRSPSQFLTSILDWAYTGWVYRTTARRLFQGFWARFGWDHIGLSAGWYRALGMLTLLGTVGASVKVGKTLSAQRPSPWIRAIGLLALSGILMWGNAFLRSHPVYPNPYLPVARYTYPAIIPTVLALAGGWWTLTPVRFRRWFVAALFATLGLLDIISLWTLVIFNYGS